MLQFSLLQQYPLCFRHGPNTATVIQPVREVGMRELAMLCHYQGLPVAARLNPAVASSKPSINTLSEQFVARLQANVPSSVSTILRTACKLQVNLTCTYTLVQCLGDHLRRRCTLTCLEQTLLLEAVCMQSGEDLVLRAWKQNIAHSPSAASDLLYVHRLQLAINPGDVCTQITRHTCICCISFSAKAAA